MNPQSELQLNFVPDIFPATRSNILEGPAGSTLYQGSFQSGNYKRLTSGWRLDADGSVQMNVLNFPFGSVHSTVLMQIASNAYASGNGFKYLYGGQASQIILQDDGGGIAFRAAGTGTADAAITFTTYLTIATGSVAVSNADFDLGGNRLINLKTTAGAPSTTDTGAYGLVYDTTNNKLYFNNGGTLKSVTLA